MSLEKPDLSGQTAFITGTTRGIGRAIALALAERETTTTARTRG
nr:hypothetical protein [Natronomonas salsuginis]